MERPVVTMEHPTAELIEDEGAFYRLMMTDLMFVDGCLDVCGWPLGIKSQLIVTDLMFVVGRLTLN